MGFTSIVGLLLALSIGVSSFVPSDETLKVAFDRGQRFYVVEDYQQAIGKFQTVKNVEVSQLVDEDKVLIRVGQVDFPVKVAATFQLANSYRGLAVERLKEAAADPDSTRASELRRQAAGDFREAVRYFKEAANITDLEEIRVLAQYQLLKTNFDIKDYTSVVQEAQTLVHEFPESDYVDEALYEKGWAEYSLGNYPEAIAAFGQLTQRNTADYRIDRAQFQIGRSYYEQGRYPEAREALGKLIERYDFTHLTESERVAMETQKLSGVVKETALELVAKAELLVGDAYVAEGNQGAATVAYRRVIERYSQERALVEQAYVKIGEAHFAQGDLEGGIEGYRQAIDEVSDRGFRARMRERIARRYYEKGHYQEALGEYDLYAESFAENGDRKAVDRARFQGAQCLFLLAEKERRQGDQTAAPAYYQRSYERYLAIVESLPRSALRPESVFGAGLALQRLGSAGDLMQAMRYYTTLQEEYPERPQLIARARLQIARLEYSRHRLEAAEREYRRYLEAYSAPEDRPQAALELAVVLRDLGRLEACAEALSLIPRSDPAWAKAGLLGGEVLLRLGRLAEAEAVTERGLEVVEGLHDRSSAGALHYIIAKIRFEKGDYARAAESFSAALDNTDRKEVRDGALLGRGSAFYQLGQYDEAAANLEELLAARPADILKDQAHRLLAQSYVRMGRRAEAIEDYEAIITAARDSQEKAEFTLLLAELFYGLGRYDRTTMSCRDVLELDFEDSEGDRGYRLKERAYFVLGDALARQGKHEEALQVFSEALREYPHSALRDDLLTGQAFSAFALERYTDAAPLLEKFIATFPKSANAENAYYFLAYSHLRLTHFEEAARWFGRLVDLFPKSDVAAEALYQRGEALFNLEHFEAAAKAYERIVSDYPESQFVDNAIYTLGWCDFESDRGAHAVTRFEDLLARFSDSDLAPSAQFTLGDYYFNQKEYDLAASAYEAVVQRYPKTEVATKARELLGELDEIRAYLRYEEAMAFFDHKDYRAAVKALEAVIAKYPKTDTRSGALANLGMSYEFLHKWKDAARVYADLVASYGDRPEGAAAVAFAQEHLTWISSNRL